MKKELTILEGYEAMYYFVENLYQETKSDALAGFLGSMRLLNDGKPADPAFWEDWLKAIKKTEKWKKSF